MSKDHFIKQLYLLLLLIFVTSCNGQVNTGSSKNSTSKSDINHVIPNENNRPVHEPLFMKNDKATTYGPKSITRNILQDKNGKFWFATWEGIISYDGKYFTNVTLKESLKQLRVFSILEDKAGNIWFGTISGGLYRYDGKSFTLFTTTDGLANNSVLCMLEDNAGYIWFGTEAGVSRYDGKTFTNFSKQHSLNGNINSIVQDKTGKLWFGTRYGIVGDLIVYDGKSFTQFKNNNGLPFSNIRSIIKDKTENIWIGGQDGLMHYDGKSLKNISTNFIGYIYEDRTGNIWLSEEEPTGWALNRYNGKSSTKLATKSMVFGIEQDDSGNIWFGTMDGVSQYNGKSIINFTD